MKLVENREEKVAEARRLRADGVTYRVIADKFGVSKTTAMRWCRPEYAKQENARRNSAKREWESGTCDRCGGRVADAKRNDLCQRCALDDRSPCARERAERFISLRKKGLLNVEIAEREGVEVAVVATVLSRACRYGLIVPRSPYFK